MAGHMKTVHGEPSWVIASDEVELSVTVRGGHMAPVTFCRGGAQPVRPYFVSAWQGAGVSTGVPVLDPLRGDFFCLPFGSGNRMGDEDHPAHGETAGSPWQLVKAVRDGAVSELRLSLATTSRPGRATKQLFLVDGHNAVYCRHVVEGFAGPACFSHHAILAVPEEPGSLRVSTGPVMFGMVPPRDNPTNDGNDYSCLAPGRRFTSLSRVPTIWKDLPVADHSTFPSRLGFMDLAAVFARAGRAPAWAAAAAPDQGWLWFSLKDPRLMPQTLLWSDNHGRHAPPWSGANRCLGIEDGRAFFHLGLAASVRRNALTAAGVPTSLVLRRDAPLAVHYIQGVARIPRRFDRVKTAAFRPGRVRFTAHGGASVEVRVAWEFLSRGPEALGGGE